MSDDGREGRRGLVRRVLGQPITTVADTLVPAVVEAVDLDEALARVDVDELVRRIDLDALARRIDVQALIERIDVDELIAKVDVQALIERVGVEQLVERIDLDTLLESVDLDRLLARLDLNAVLARLDVDGLVAKLDVDGLVGKVDVDGLISKVDVDGLVRRVDVDALVDRVDVDRLVQRVNVDALVQRVDVDALVQRVDVEQITGRLDIGSMVTRSTGGLLRSTLDLARRQLVGLDALVLRLVDRAFGRGPAAIARGPAALVGADEAVSGVTGRFAGPVSRLAALAVDVGAILGGFALASSVLTYVVKLLTGYQLERGSASGVWWGLLLAGWAFFYLWVSLALSGRSIGMGLVGLRVVALDGGPVGQRQAFARVVAFPFSFVLLIGLFMGLLSRDRRTFHDRVARTCVVYDWGDRPAQLPAPLTRWLTRRGAIDGMPVAPLP